MLSLYSFAQKPVVKGTVSIYNSNKKPVQGAIVSTKTGDADESDTYGLWKIEFSGDSVEKTIELTVNLHKTQKYKDYIVVEQQQDGLKEITIGREDVRVSICTKEEFKKRIDTICKQLNINLAEQQEKEINELNKKLDDKILSEQQYKENLENITQKYNALKKAYEELANYYACYNPDFIDSIREKVIYYIQQGKLDSAQYILPDIEKAKKMKEMGENYLEDIRRIALARNKMEIVESIDTTLYNASNFFNSRIRTAKDFYSKRSIKTVYIDKAFYYGNEALKISTSSLDSIITYNLLGQIQKDQHNLKAHKNYKNAIKIYKQLKKDGLDNNKAKEYVAISHTLRADYYKEKNKTQRAENNYKKAIALYIAMSKDSVQDDFNYLQCLIKTADLYSMTGKSTVLTQCNERIDILMKIANFDEERQTDNNMQMGLLNLNSNPHVAYTNYDLALRYYLTKDKIIYRDKVVKAALGAAIACNNDRDYTKIIEYCDTISNRINIDSTVLSVAVHVLLGNAYKRSKDIKDKEKAKYHFNKAKEISKKIKDEKMDDFIYSLKHERWILWRDLLVYNAIGWGAVYFSYLLIPLL
jgi:tetratricopeptide (TPR) repeat protein